jgi:chromosomal replication initiation ATPase DnaA
MNVFDFNWNPKYDEQLFVLGKSNFNAFNWLQNTDKWPNKQIVLYGPQYSGKTHLSTIWCEKHNGKLISKTTQYEDIDKKKHRHYVDIYIPSQNRMIEVKSTWTAEKKKDNIFLKQDAVKKMGYLYEIWVYDDKGIKVQCHV